MKKHVYTGAPWEKQVAYCRAIRVDKTICVSGTTAVDEHGLVVGRDNLYEQTRYIFHKIEGALRELDASMSDVVRTRMFITNIDDFGEFARAHQEVFEGIDPAASCVEISRLVNDDLLIEIEVDAIISS